jgi:hypothetical protein
MHTPRLILATAAATAACAVAAPLAAAAPGDPAAQAPGQQGCNAVLVSNGPVDVSLLGQVNVHTDAVSVSVNLSGLVGSIVCGVIGGGAAPAVPVG